VDVRPVIDHGYESIQRGWYVLGNIRSRAVSHSRAKDRGTLDRRYCDVVGSSSDVRNSTAWK